MSSHASGCDVVITFKMPSSVCCKFFSLQQFIYYCFVVHVIFSTDNNHLFKTVTITYLNFNLPHTQTPLTSHTNPSHLTHKPFSPHKQLQLHTLTSICLSNLSACGFFAISDEIKHSSFRSYICEVHM